jgi:hypothetical protein
MAVDSAANDLQGFGTTMSGKRLFKPSRECVDECRCVSAPHLAQAVTVPG